MAQGRSHSAQDAHGKPQTGGEQLSPDRRGVEHRQPEIALQGPQKPQDVLHVQRLIEAERGLHLGNDLGGGLGRHQHVDRVAGHDVNQPEDHEGDAEQNRDRLK